MSIRWLLSAMPAAALIRNDTARLGKVIRDAGIRAE